jgi:hypothetical protein
MIGFSDDD